MTTHVLIVDSITFKVHLEYQFVGTGAQDNRIDFNNVTECNLSPNTENMLTGMIADFQRLRKGDYVIFYLQQSKEAEGKFYGIFKVKSEPFLDNLTYLKKELINLSQNYKFDYPSNPKKFKIKNKEALIKTALRINEEKNLLRKFDINDKEEIASFVSEFYDDNQFLLKELEKSLTFRVFIEPHKVYAEGVTEWEALDEIKHIKSPNQMLWSLIYRKLKGNRGNTMITIYESERLCQLIRNKNSRHELDCDNKPLSFDVNTQKIILSGNDIKHYEGRQEELNVLPRLIRKYNEGKSFEPHLQAYIVQVIGKRINSSLDDIVIENSTIEWIGNEVSCGVGMQRIDIMLSLVNNDQRVIVPIELKAVEADENNTIQLQRYIDWIEQYYLPNRQSDIQPILISKKFSRSSTKHDDLITSFNEFNEFNEDSCAKLKYVEFEENDGALIFNEQHY
ncbi:MAG: DUF91 domain-containing protein [Planctomycetota bacterium]|jgi:hypothetical protein